MSVNNKNSIEIKNLYKSFGRKEVLQGVSLSLSNGDIFGLVGLNGTGKTTFVRILLGLMNGDKGVCTVLGMNPSCQQRNYYRKVGAVMEQSGFFGNLTVHENLRFFGEAKGVKRDQVAEYFSEYWKDTAIGKDTRKVKYFSRGQKMQCALCRAFLGWPEVYFFDEPVVALDMEAYDRFCELVHIVQSRGATVIISSHQLEAIEDLCTSVGILEKGHIDFIEKTGKNHEPVKWFIKTENNSACKEIIEEISGNSADYDNGLWRFEVPFEDESVIPEIISRIVKSGFPVYEVRPDNESFRKSIKTYYKNNS